MMAQFERNLYNLEIPAGSDDTSKCFLVPVSTEPDLVEAASMEAYALDHELTILDRKFQINTDRIHYTHNKSKDDVIHALLQGNPVRVLELVPVN